jgi:LuxR family maltose regulon positive regulatory protein
MPKPARYTLLWSAEREVYTAREEKQGNVIQLRENDQAWFEWLASRTSFSFHGRRGHLNLLKEKRTRGSEGYWYAYVRQGKRTTKQYAGRTADLTFVRLEQLADTLSIHAFHAAPTCKLAFSLQDEVVMGPLLTSQLHPPRLSAPLIARHTLLTALDVSLKRKLTLLSAPAGFGKTTLLVQWAERQALPVAWLSLGDEQNDPRCFLRYLIGSLQQVQPGFGSNTLTSSRFSPSISLNESIVCLLNALTSLSGEMTMILDNYHLIKNDVIHNALTLLLDHLPPHLHLIIASRSEPHCLSARLHASGQTTELRTDALRLTRGELEQLLPIALHLKPEPQELDELEARLEGWIAGVYLARSILPGQVDVAQFLAACAGTNRHIQTYFLEEVLADLPPDVQNFMLSTVLLERFNSSLCAVVTGQEHSVQMLEELAHANLFFSPLLEQEGWYRYHPLFVSALSQFQLRVQPERVVMLHSRASQWFEAHALPEDAIKHALTAKEYSRAATLIEEIAPTLISRGNLTILRNWLDALPEQVVRLSPRLCICRVWQEFIISQPNTFIQWVEAAEQALHRLEETLPQSTVAALQSEIIALRSIYTVSLADFSETITACHQALQQLPADSHYLRGLILMLLGLAYARSSDVGEAARALSKANSNIHAAGHAFLEPYVIMAQAELYATQGYPFQAAILYRQVLSLETGQSDSSLFVAGFAHLGLGMLLWEWNNLAESRHHLLHAWQMGQRTQTITTLFHSSLLLALEAHVRGDSVSMRSWLQHLEALSQHATYIEITEIIAPIRASVMLAQGRLEEALFWMREQNLHRADPSDKRSELIDLTQARVLIAAGHAHMEPDAGARALERLEYWYVTADQAGRVRVLIEVLILQALALELQNDRAGALCRLKRAVTLAEPGRYIRLFVAEGDPLAHILRHLLEQQRICKASERTVSIAYLSTLLKAFAKPCTFRLPTAPADSRSLIDPLSLREREVLRLIALGRKNREIADELVVVTGTVKAHINMIYQKLGVTNRVQAITRARTLGLL